MEQGFKTLLAGCTGAFTVGTASATAAAKYGPWWAVPFATVAGGYVGFTVGIITAL